MDMSFNNSKCGKMEKSGRSLLEKKGSKSSKTHSLSLNVQSERSPPVVDVSQVYSMLQKVIPEVEKKKTKDMIEDDKFSQLSNWTYIRPFMSFDFVEDNFMLPSPPIAVIPCESQEYNLLDDLISVLGGFQGQYITANTLLGRYSARTFVVTDSIEPTLRQVVLQILPLASNYSTVIRFVQEKRQLRWGRVNLALSSAINTFISDYSIFLAKLENLLRKKQLNLQNMWVYLQSTIQTFEVLANIVNYINQEEARGGRILTILHEETLHYIHDNNAQRLCLFLTGEASVPYFDSLQRWLYKGIVFDPYNEFMIRDNVELEADANSVTGLYSDGYWNQRYTICEPNVPVFLRTVQETILRTGRYLNVVRQCSETTRSSVSFKVLPMDKLIYSLHGERYMAVIENAYQFASSTLLDLLLTEYDIINRIKSLKRYFLMEQGDFIVQLLDLCEEELMKPISEVIPSRLQSLFELALRTSTGKHDPYKEDVTLTILTKNNTFQIFSIQNIGSENDKQIIDEDDLQEWSKTGLEGFAFQVVSKWPLSLLFNQKIIGCYQMLFRHLVHCKHVDRRLCQVWISDKAVKQIPVTASSGYLGAFSLRQRMLFCVQNLQYYMMEEAIEPNWIRFMTRIQDVRNIDDLLSEHWDFVDQCMKDCMFMNHDLIAIINKILAACIEFCDFIQASEDAYSQPEENLSFEQNIKRLDDKFTAYLVTLLCTISNIQEEEVVEKLRNILYRENFNGFYTELMEKHQRSIESTASTSTSG